MYKGELALVMEHYHTIKNQKLRGRYINQDHIAPILEKLSNEFDIKEIGKSVKGEPIHHINLGEGSIRILAWSQMHGNESTTTKAVFDLLNAFSHRGVTEPFLKKNLKSCSIRIIPMLNPDGARAYTRTNANDVDLNRDAHDLKEQESKLLRREFEEFQPHFCLNLHDQRTIFSAGEVAKPATLSFLTPSSDEARTINKAREKSMQVISSIYKDLNQVLPNQIGRYDDAFNINCSGDSFQSLQVPTILYEAGHFEGDYNREKTREFVFAALISALGAIADQSYKTEAVESYFEIPENKKLFNDIILRKANFKNKEVDIAIQFKEELVDNSITFKPYIEKIGKKISNTGHREIQCEGKKLDFPGEKKAVENVIVNKISLNGVNLNLNCE